jgi:hypothetical protein
MTVASEAVRGLAYVLRHSYLSTASAGEINVSFLSHLAGKTGSLVGLKSYGNAERNAQHTVSIGYGTGHLTKPEAEPGDEVLH